MNLSSTDMNVKTIMLGYIWAKPDAIVTTTFLVHVPPLLCTNQAMGYNYNIKRGTYMRGAELPPQPTLHLHYLMPKVCLSHRASSEPGWEKTAVGTVFWDTSATFDVEMKYSPTCPFLLEQSRCNKT